ncbi:MAG: alginate O-acetyltransferase AlgX-related protein [Bacteroidia bacterium]
MRRLKRMIFGTILCLLLLPILQNLTGVFTIDSLNGYFRPVDLPELTWEHWMSGTYQPTAAQFVEEHTGLRNVLIRINNQVNYSFFNKPAGDGVTPGKNGNFFIRTYIDAYTGNDFAGKDASDERMHKLRFLQDEWEKNGKTFVLVLAPGKASFYPEDIPDEFLATAKTPTNYQYTRKKCDDLGIHYLDMNAYFCSLKKNAKTKYLYYPRCGTHLSKYGSEVMADTIVKYIEKVRAIDLPDLAMKGMKYKGPNYLDDDITELINLFSPPENPSMEEPDLVFTDGPGKTRPRVITIGDSYYEGLIYTKIPKRLFRDSQYWQYNKYVYSDSMTLNGMMENLDVKTELEKSDVIMILATEATLFRLSYGFIDDAYALYAPKTKQEKTAFYRKLILEDKQWKSEIAASAMNKNITLDSAVSVAAALEYEKEAEKESRIAAERVAAIADRIRKDPAYMALIVGKAKDRGVSTGEMIRMDAEWLFDQENKNTH